MCALEGTIAMKNMRYSILPAALFACAFAASSANADLLLYDGFATETDGQNRLAYLSTLEDHPLQHGTGNGKSLAWTTGFGANDWWSDTSAVVNSFPNKGLSLPDIFANGTGDQFAARGGGAGYHRDGTPGQDSNNNTGIRCKNRKISSAMPTSGKLYYRCLMQIDSTAFAAFKGTAWKYVGTGISAASAANAYDNQTDLINKGIRLGFSGRSDQSPARVDLAISVGGQYKSLIEGISAGTTYIVIAEIDYAAAKAKAYAAPVSDYSTSFAWTVENLAVASTVTASAMNVMFFAGHFQTGNGYVVFDEIAAGTELSDVAVVEAATSPVLGDVSLSRTGAAKYSISAEVLENAADTVSWIADDGLNAPTTNSFATAVATNTTASGTIFGLAAKTYQVSVLAENSGGSATKTAGVIYTGELALDAANATDAVEYGLVAGGVTVSRATADPWPLTVNYTVSGSAGTEGTTWVAPTPVTIPANATSATLPVVPLMDGNVTEDITITVTLAAGNYDVPSANTATLTLVNFAPPAGKKTWVATANGNASDGNNWFPAGAPTSDDNILFDGNFSNARCIWDAAATHEVASWEQVAAFTGTVELQTTYESGAFSALAIVGDCTVNGGVITQTANSNAQTYRLSMTVGGNLVTASGTQITATGKGYATGYPSGVTAGTHGGSVSAWSQVYGDFRNPTDIGAGGGSSGLTGGGAIRLAVTGAATVNGKILARPSASDQQYHVFGAGGSIYLSAASIEGSGEINASGYGSQAGGRAGGGGGRVALYVTGEDSMSFPLSKVTATGTVGAWNTSGGAGTIFVKTRNQTNGTLVVDDVTVTQTEYRQYLHTRHAATPIPTGGTWTLDELRFRNSGILVVPAGTTLNVPLAAISSTSDRTAGILYEGGTINFTDVPAGGPYALTGKWVFQASVPYTFDGDVTISGNAAIGGLRMSGTFNDFATCDVTVQGNLNVASDGWLFADNAGLAGGASGYTTGLARHGGQMAGSSGNICYDSVFAPCLPAVNSTPSHEKESPGGGVIKLVVNGALTLDGKATARGPVLYKGAGSGGTINITARTLSGSGSISASGNVGNIAWDKGYNGAGGRIAVRVTGEDIGTTGIWTKFSAQGVVTNQVNEYWKVNADRIQNTSAGTIYLQGMSDGEKGGTIYVKNQASYDTSNVATWLPAGTLGDAAADFASSKLVIADRGVVAIGENIKFASVSIAENSKLDLAGKNVKVSHAYLNGERLKSGEYTASSDDVAGYVVDSVGGGTLRVGEGGFTLIIR